MDSQGDSISLVLGVPGKPVAAEGDGAIGNASKKSQAETSQIPGCKEQDPARLLSLHQA